MDINITEIYQQRTRESLDKIEKLLELEKTFFFEIIEGWEDSAEQVELSKTKIFSVSNSPSNRNQNNSQPVDDHMSIIKSLTSNNPRSNALLKQTFTGGFHPEFFERLKRGTLLQIETLKKQI